MENHHFQWVNPLFLWPCSIANCLSLPEGKLWTLHVCRVKRFEASSLLFFRPGMLRQKSLRETLGKPWATKVRKSWGGKAGYNIYIYIYIAYIYIYIYIYIYMVGKCAQTVWQWFHLNKEDSRKDMGWSNTLHLRRLSLGGWECCLGSVNP